MGELWLRDLPSPCLSFPSEETLDRAGQCQGPAGTGVGARGDSPHWPRSRSTPPAWPARRHSRSELVGCRTAVGRGRQVRGRLGWILHRKQNVPAPPQGLTRIGVPRMASSPRKVLPSRASARRGARGLEEMEAQSRWTEMARLCTATTTLCHRPSKRDATAFPAKTALTNVVPGALA